MAFGVFLTAVAALVANSLLIMLYIPLRRIFAVTGGLIFVLTDVFDGKGVAALQAAGFIISNHIQSRHVYSRRLARYTSKLTRFIATAQPDYYCNYFVE